MKKKDILILALIIIIVSLSFIVIIYNVKGYEEGYNSAMNYVRDYAEKEGYVIIYDQSENETITLIEYNESINWCEDMFLEILGEDELK